MTQLTLKWRRADHRHDGYLGYDPEVWGEIAVVAIYEAQRSMPDPPVWSWSLTPCAITSVVAELPVRHGIEATPREAAARAEACYRRYMKLTPPERVASELDRLRDVYRRFG